MKLLVATWRWLLAGSFLFSAATHAQAQLAPAATAPHGYDFLTVAVRYAYNADFARIYFFPAFQSKTEIMLESGPAPGEDMPYSTIKIQLRHKAAERHNAELLNQQLGELTANGWELAQVWSTKGELVNYLFRKARP